MLNIRRCIGVSTLVVLSVVPSLAQFESGSVLGAVTDPSGKVISGASITLMNVRTGTSLRAKTDASGNFQFVNQRLGTYRVRAEMTGFKAAETSRSISPSMPASASISPWKWAQ